MTGSGPGQDTRAARQRSQALVVGYAGLMLTAGAVGAVVGFSRHHGQHPARGVLLGGGVLLAVAVLGGALLWWLLRRPHLQRPMAFGWQRRFRVAKQLRRGQLVTDEDWPLATAIDDGIRRQWWAPLLYVLLVVLAGSNVVTHHGVVRWLYAAWGLALCLLVPYAIRERSRIRAGYQQQCARHEGSVPPSP